MNRSETMRCDSFELAYIQRSTNIMNGVSLASYQVLLESIPLNHSFNLVSAVLAKLTLFFLGAGGYQGEEMAQFKATA
jgi:hypothetical protein